MIDLNTIPAIKRATGQAPLSEAMTQAVVLGFQEILSAPSRAVDRFEYSDEALEVVLNNKLALTRTAFERSQSVVGRLLNRLTHEYDPCYVEFSGTHLRQVFHVGAISVPDQIGAAGTYLLRRDIVEACKATLDAALARRAKESAV